MICCSELRRREQKYDRVAQQGDGSEDRCASASVLLKGQSNDIFLWFFHQTTISTSTGRPTSNFDFCQIHVELQFSILKFPKLDFQFSTSLGSKKKLYLKVLSNENNRGH
jgi:hypothetical protein